MGTGGLPQRFTDGDGEVDYSPDESPRQRAEEDEQGDREETEDPGNDAEAMKALAAEAHREAIEATTRLLEEAMIKLLGRLSKASEAAVPAEPEIRPSSAR